MQRLNGDTPWYLKDLVVEEEDHVIAYTEDRLMRVNDNYIGRAISSSGAENIPVGDDAAVHFTPFSGDENDLMEILRTNPNHQPLEKDENGINLFRRSLAGTLCCIILLIMYAFKDRIKLSSALDPDQKEESQQASDLEDDPKDNAKITKDSEVKESSTGVKERTNTNKDLNAFFRGDPDSDIDQDENKQHKESEFLLQIDRIDSKNNGKRDLSGFFQNDVPALAEVISLSGLDKQESIKIVTKEIFETDRRNAEVNLNFYSESLYL